MQIFQGLSLEVITATKSCVPRGKEHEEITEGEVGKGCSRVRVSGRACIQLCTIEAVT